LEGGQTRFFANMTSAFSGTPYLSVAPETGTALIFEHDIWHEGAPVTKGKKYVLRTDVMYQNPPRRKKQK